MIAGKNFGSLINESVYLFVYLGVTLAASIGLFKWSTK